MKNKVAEIAGHELRKSDNTIFENLIWMTVEQTAKYLSRSENAIRILFSRKILKKYGFDSVPYTKRSEVDALMESGVLNGGF